MWISKTPLRVSLFSGGDMEAFWEYEDGWCLSSTIDKYITITASKSPNQGVRTSQAHFGEMEHVNDPSELKNVLIRECLKIHGIDSEITISAMSDIDAHGSGLGSSSAFTVGLLAVLRGYCNVNTTKWDLARDACTVEIRRCRHPIGKQDQYAAAIGGLNLFKFRKDGEVETQCNSKAVVGLNELQDRLMLVYSGINRKANDILKEQNKNLELDRSKFLSLVRNAQRAKEAYKLLESKSYDEIGHMLHDAWLDKKSVASGISNPEIDAIYEKARSFGALGGKLVGAGGGGFFIFYINPDLREVLEQSLEPLKVHPFKFVDHGVTVTGL